MSELPDITYLDTARDEGAMKSGFFGPIIDAVAEMPGGAAKTELTIAAGSVTPTAALHKIDTEGNAATDDLTHIDYTNHPEGRVIVISNVNAGRVVTLKNESGGNGEMVIADDADLELLHPYQTVTLARVGTQWLEIGRDYGPEKQAARDNLGDGAKLRRTGKRTAWIPAAVMYGHIVSGGASSADTHEDGGTTNASNQVKGWAFDPDAVQRIDFSVGMPKSWDNGSVRWRIAWQPAVLGAGGSVVWSIAGRGFDDGEDMGASGVGATVSVTDAAIAAEAFQLTDWTATGGASALPSGDNGMLLLQLFRTASDGSDTLDEDAVALGIFMEYTIDQERDD